MYNYNHLYYFYVTVKSGGVTNAAKNLRLSQPSLSSQLKLLEQSLEVKLFNKVGRKNELTNSGTAIYSFCHKMFELSDEMRELITKRKTPSTSRRLHIGISEEVDRSFVVQVVSSFLKKYPLKERPQISLISGSREQLTESLRFRELDLLVSDIATIDPDTTKIAYAEIPVVLTCSGKMDSSTLSNDALKILINNKETQWIMPSNKLKLKHEIDQYFESNGISSTGSFVTDSIASVVRAVQDEIGFAFLPLQFVSQEVREKSLQVIGSVDGYWKYRVWLVSQQHNKHDELIQSLAQSFNEICMPSTQMHMQDFECKKNCALINCAV